MGIVTRHDHSINRIPWIDRQRSILIINTLESLCILTLARNDPTFRSLGHRCSSHAESNCNFSQRGNTGIRPPLLLLSTRAVRYTHATAIRLDGGHTITRLLIAGRSCTPRLVFAYLVCQCCIDHLQGGEREGRVWRLFVVEQYRDEGDNDEDWRMTGRGGYCVTRYRGDFTRVCKSRPVSSYVGSPAAARTKGSPAFEEREWRKRKEKKREEKKGSSRWHTLVG